MKKKYFLRGRPDARIEATAANASVPISVQPKNASSKLLTDTIQKIEFGRYQRYLFIVNIVNERYVVAGRQLYNCFFKRRRLFLTKCKKNS